MAKARKNVSLDPEVAQTLEDMDNASRWLNEKIKVWKDIEAAEKQELVREKEEKEKKLEEKEEQKEALEREITDLEGQINSLEQAITDIDKAENKLEKKLPKLAEEWETIRRKTHDPDEASKRLKTRENFHKFKDELGMSPGELIEQVEKEVSDSDE